MKNLNFFLLLLFLSLTAKSQRKDTSIYYSCGPIPKDENERVGQEKTNGKNADECPKFPKGDEGLDHYLNKASRQQIRDGKATSIL